MRLVADKNLDVVINALQSGKTAIFPTETSYGLGCDATNQAAVDKIFKIKGRKSDKPLLVVVPNAELAKKYVVWNEQLEKISKKYWPGPLTIVGEYQSDLSPTLPLKGEGASNIPLFKEGSASRPGEVTDVRMIGFNRTLKNRQELKKNKTRPLLKKRGVLPLAHGVVSRDNTLAIRVTAHPLLKSITEKLGRPLVATSANISDAGDVYDPKEILMMFSGREAQPDILLDYGVLLERPPTTIVSVIGGEIKLLRQGEIKIVWT